MRRVILAWAVLLAISVPSAGAAADETILISRATNGTVADDNSNQASVSPDGRYVAFASSANNLAVGENEGVHNVFLRDTQMNTTTLVSRQSDAAGGAGADDSSSLDSLNSVSSAGQFVAFESTANNLVVGENESVNNIFVRDTIANTTTLISQATDGTPADSGSSDATISADGRYVSFQSGADNLSTADDNSLFNTFVRDTVMGTTTLTSRNSGGAAANASSVDPAISGNGGFVVFETNATNLDDDNEAGFDIFRHDVQTGATILVSRQSASVGGAGGDGESNAPTVSHDGRFVAFDSTADNLSSEDNNAFFNIFVRDVQSSTTILASRQSASGGGAPADGFSDESMIAANGGHVVFESVADNLSDADDNAVQNIFVRDLATNTTLLASRQSAADGGAGANQIAAVPSISADGRFASFQSSATNLSAIDGDPTFDVFVRDMSPAAGGGGVGGGGGTTDTKPPVLELTAKKSQAAGKPVKLQAKSDEACTLSLTGSAKPKGEKKGKLKPVSDQLATGIAETLKLKPSGKLKKALAQADKGKAKVAGACTDAAGNPSQDALKVKLK